MALAAHERGESVALVTVISTSGSTPRHPGAHMAVLSSGESIGTIGGGRIELAATEAGQAVCAGAPARLLQHHLVRDLAMCCGGAMSLYIEPVGPSAEVLAAMVDAAARRVMLAVDIPLDGGPWRIVQGTDAESAVQGLREGESVFRQVVRPRERLIVFGLGHVARALLAVVAGLEFELVVVDDDETEALERLPAGVDRVIDSFEVRDVERAIGPLGERDYVVIVTRDHAVDERIVEQLIGNAALRYLGLIGSQGKVGRFKKRLVSKGLYDEAAWSRLRAPIGMELGAETPAEIAVAIAAELVSVRHQRGSR